MKDLNELRRKAQELIDLDTQSVAEYVPVWNEYIQAANPSAVLALLSHLEQAEQAVVLAEAECARQREHKGVFARRAAEAEQRVARVWEVATGDPIEYGWSEAMFAVLRALDGEPNE